MGGRREGAMTDNMSRVLWVLGRMHSASSMYPGRTGLRTRTKSATDARPRILIAVDSATAPFAAASDNTAVVARIIHAQATTIFATIARTSVPDNTTKIVNFLKPNKARFFCHHCVSQNAGVTPTNQVNQIIRPLGRGKDFRYMKTTCSACSADAMCVAYVG